MATGAMMDGSGLFALACEKRQVAKSLVRLAVNMGIAAHRTLLNQHAKRLEEEAFNLEVQAALAAPFITTCVECAAPRVPGELANA
jgi:hypothetical protein